MDCFAGVLRKVWFDLNYKLLTVAGLAHKALWNSMSNFFVVKKTPHLHICQIDVIQTKQAVSFNSQCVSL